MVIKKTLKRNSKKSLKSLKKVGKSLKVNRSKNMRGGATQPPKTGRPGPGPNTGKHPGGPEPATVKHYGPPIIKNPTAFHQVMVPGDLNSKHMIFGRDKTNTYARIFNENNTYVGDYHKNPDLVKSTNHVVILPEKHDSSKLSKANLQKYLLEKTKLTEFKRNFLNTALIRSYLPEEQLSQRQLSQPKLSQEDYNKQVKQLVKEHKKTLHSLLQEQGIPMSTANTRAERKHNIKTRYVPDDF